MLLIKITVPIFFFMLIQYILLVQVENKKLKIYIFNQKCCIEKVLNGKSVLVYPPKKYLISKQKKKVGRGCSRAYMVFDIIKIFGRISDKELLGHVISHNNEFIELDRNKKKKWEILFDNDYINFDKLKFFLKNNKFEWPLTINSGQIKNQDSINIPVSPIIYVENCKKISEEFKNKNKSIKINLQIINDYVSKLPICDDAIQCVFSSFSDFDNLTKDQFINRIHEWTPSDGVVDWYTFVYNLKEGPIDNIKKFFD